MKNLETIQNEINKNKIHENEYTSKEDFQMHIFKRYSTSTYTGCLLHWHECIELFCVCKGSLTINIGSNSIVLEQGDIAVINPHELHRSFNFQDNTEHIILKIDRLLIDSRIADLCNRKYVSPLFYNKIKIQNAIRKNENIYNKIMTLYDLAINKNVAWELEFKGVVFTLFSSLISNYSVVNNITAKKRNNYIATKAVEYINNNFKHIKSISEISKHIKCNKSYLCREFKLQTGYTPIEYINILRCESANELLKDSDLTVTEIAFAVGFNDSNYFSRVYKSIFGFSPVVTRRN